MENFMCKHKKTEHFGMQNSNKDVIYKKARKIYRNVVKIHIPFFINISCDFKLLEEKSKIYT